MASYQELHVWQKAMDLAVEIYKITVSLPKEEQYAMTTQIRRAAISVPSNIAEGAGRKSAKEFDRFLKIAYGSLNELETQLLLCCRLGYIRQTDTKNAFSLSSEIGRMLNAMIQKLNT